MSALDLRSPLAVPLEQFLEFKRSMGCVYRGGEGSIRALDRFLESRLPTRSPIVTLDIVRDFVARRGSETETTRAGRLTLIRQFCRFRAGEDPRTAIPPPRFLAIRRTTFVPRVLSLAEGRAFLKACMSYPRARSSPLRGVVQGTTLALLYLTGLRLGEALRLSIEDVDLASGVLRVRRAKFGKTRLVPIAADLTEKLRVCRDAVDLRLGTRGPEAPFFPGRKKTAPYSGPTMLLAHRQNLARAGIPKDSRGRWHRIHDLRHTFAVHRLVLWCRQDANLNAKLPLLAVYMGHVSLASTQRYLRITADVLDEITRRHHAKFGHLIETRPQE